MDHSPDASAVPESVSVPDPDYHRDMVLLAQIREGNEQAFNAVVGYYLEPLYRFAYLRTQDSQLADDIAQDVLVQLWEHRASLDDSGNLKGYLFRSARNRTFKYLRHERSVQRVAQVYVQNRTIGDTPSVANEHTDADLELAEALRSVQDAVRKLPPRTREIFMLWQEQGMSASEIAATFGIGIPTVQNQMSRALNAVRAALQRWRSGSE